MSTVYSIPLRNLSNWNPFANVVWRELDRPITKQEVESAIVRGRFRARPYNRKSREPSRKWHIERIAYLVVNPDLKPIDIDVGVPELGGWSPSWIIYDGNHRLAAAEYRNDSNINCFISGSLNYAAEVLDLNPEHDRNASYCDCLNCLEIDFYHQKNDLTSESVLIVSKSSEDTNHDQVDSYLQLPHQSLW